MKKIETENHVKDIVRQWCDRHDAYHFAVVSNGLGMHGIHDRLMALPVVITQEMIGKKIAVFASIEAKRPGRRGEKDRGMSKHQVIFMEGVQEAGGLSICCDGEEDLAELECLIDNLTMGPVTPIPDELKLGGDLDDDHPLWLVNEQIKGLLEGDGASEDHESVLAFLRTTKLPEETVRRMHRALVCSEQGEQHG